MKKFICFLLAFVMFSMNVNASDVVWLYNVNQYVEYNHNIISNFENGYAVFSLSQMDKNWQTSNQRAGVIDKFGSIVYGPLDGVDNINILEGGKFYVESTSDKSWIFDLSTRQKVDFDGFLGNGGDFSESPVTLIVKGGYATPVCGLVRSDGKMILEFEYSGYIPSDNGYVFAKTRQNCRNVDVYNADGSFSRRISSVYRINGYEKNMIELYDKGCLGAADAYGNVILEPVYNEVHFLSENRIWARDADMMGYIYDCYGNVIKSFGKAYDLSILSENRIFVGGDKSCITDYDGNIIKEYDSRYNATKMYDNRFMICGDSLELVTENGETIQQYDGDIYRNSVFYAGNGVYEIRYKEHGYNDYIRFIDAETGEFIGGKYKQTDSSDFNEGYVTVEDLDGNKYVMDKDGNKYYEEYSPTKGVSDGMLIVHNHADEQALPGIIHVPKYKPTKLLIHNNSVTLSSKPQKIDNRTFYPFRDCLENLGATVRWDDARKRAIGEYNGVTVEFPIGEKRYYINGVEYQMDTAAYINNSSGKTYIPIRYAAEAFGFVVDWAETDAAYTVSVHR